MKSVLLPSILLSTSFAFAAPLQFNVNGMHCGACKAAIEKEICAKGDFAKCEANLVDTKKQTGELIIETKPGQTADSADIMKRIEKLGYKAEPASKTPAKKK